MIYKILIVTMVNIYMIVQGIEIVMAILNTNNIVTDHKLIVVYVY